MTHRPSLLLDDGGTDGRPARRAAFESAGDGIAAYADARAAQRADPDDEPARPHLTKSFGDRIEFVESPAPWRNPDVMALLTLALGLALFALFYGLVAACDRL